MKIDLRRSRSTMVDPDALDSGFIIDGEKNIFSFLSRIDLKLIFNIIIKLVICCMGTVVLMQYEQVNLRKLEVQKKSADSEYSQLQKQEKNIQEKIGGFTYLKDKSVEFTNKLSIMNGVVQKRLVVIRGLDHIQDVIPEKVWLDKVSFSKDKFILNGFSSTNKQVQDFIENMEKTNIFKRVVLDKVSEQGALKQKRFTIHVTFG